MPALDQLPAFDDKGCLRVVIEASAGTISKLKYQPELQAFELHLVLPAGTAFPLDFGFVPSTHGEDGDPLDALVFADEPLPAGTVVGCRLLGVVQALQSRKGGKRVRNDRFLAVAAHSHRYGSWRDIGDVPRPLLQQLEAFFVSYNEQRGVRFEPVARRGAAAAARILAKTG